MRQLRLVLGDGCELARAQLAVPLTLDFYSKQHLHCTAVEHHTVGCRVHVPNNKNMSFGSMTAAKADYAVPSPPSDGVSDLSFSPNGTLLTAGSWDNGVS